MTDKEVYEMANEINELQELRSSKKLSYRDDNITASRMVDCEVMLAVEFGKRRGWKWVDKFNRLGHGWRSDFTLRTLREGKVKTYDPNGQEWPSTTYMDHPEYYRMPYPDNRAVAIAAHNYGEYSHEEANEWAEKKGMKAEVITDFPSWYWPERTHLIVYTRLHGLPEKKIVKNEIIETDKYIVFPGVYYSDRHVNNYTKKRREQKRPCVWITKRQKFYSIQWWWDNVDCRNEQLQKELSFIRSHYWRLKRNPYPGELRTIHGFFEKLTREDALEVAPIIYDLLIKYRGTKNHE